MITMHLPVGAQPPDVGKEISSAKRIKDRSVRQSTLSGLHRIAQYL